MKYIVPIAIFIIVLLIIYQTRENYRGAEWRKAGISFDEIAKQMGRERENEIRSYELEKRLIDVSPAIRSQFPEFHPVLPSSGYEKVLETGSTIQYPTGEGYVRLNVKKL